VLTLRLLRLLICDAMRVAIEYRVCCCVEVARVCVADVPRELCVATADAATVGAHETRQFFGCARSTSFAETERISCRTLLLRGKTHIPNLQTTSSEFIVPQGSSIPPFTAR